MKNVLLLLFALPFYALSQTNGLVIDEESKEPIYGAKIIASSGEKALSDVDGSFELNIESYPVTLIVFASTYINDTILVTDPRSIMVTMRMPVQEIKTVVVTAGRRDQDIEDVPISMEIIRPELYDNKGLANIEEAVDQSPGVYAMDGQVSIRGGSGFAYGAGSRVLLLWNGIPMLSGDAGDAKWTSIPMECASQIEILKGASSVLYGSGALNGIISLREREPGNKGQARFKVQGGFYDSPKRSTLKWWSKTPTFYQGEAYYGKMHKKFGYTVSVNGYSNDGFREGETEDRGRVSGTLFFRPEKLKSLKAGIGYNLYSQKIGSFIIWQSDTFAYNPSGGADTSNASSTLSYSRGIRLSIDPYVKFFDKKKNLHTLKTRYYLVTNENITNSDQSSNARILYGDYQFQHKWNKGTAITLGLTGIRNDVVSKLYGDHFANNMAAYAQYEQRFDKLDVTGGIRLEYSEQDNIRGDSDYYLGKDSTGKIPVYPVIRLGTHYQLAKYTHLRASFGQGIRYPSVAERYTSTNVGALIVFPNPHLTAETGWAAEIGVKQAVKIGKNWKGLIDIAGFVNQYDNMMEFQFGVFNPETAERLDPTSSTYGAEIASILGNGYTINDIFGFSAVNAEAARITGLELSFNSQGKIKQVELTSLIGYTYMNPVSLNTDSAYVATFSDSGSTVLKYRFKHLIKADVEAKWKGISLGFSARYNSYMENIDKIFEEEIIDGLYILPGLKNYRKENNRGNLVFDARIGYEFLEHYRVGFIVNNLFNEEYVTRPGDVKAPRNFIFQLQMKF
ncbi:MAG: TonB-dependent receptor [Crocinitomicaceae bacterium]|nr:TonB-dependent receptor [Crocinitomicaceae bacterium]